MLVDYLKNLMLRYIGQTVPHVHVHLYPEYEKGEIEVEESGSKTKIVTISQILIERQPRLIVEMANEAKGYKEYFKMKYASE